MHESRRFDVRFFTSLRHRKTRSVEPMRTEMNKRVNDKPRVASVIETLYYHLRKYDSTYSGYVAEY